MVVVIVIGYIVARFVAKAITTLAEKLGLQNAADQSGLADSMQHMGMHRNVPAIIGTIVFWLLMCVFLMAGFNILGLQGRQRRDARASSTTFPSCWSPPSWSSSVCWSPRSCGAWSPPVPIAWACPMPSTWPTAATTCSPC